MDRVTKQFLCFITILILVLFPRIWDFCTTVQLPENIIRNKIPENKEAILKINFIKNLVYKRSASFRNACVKYCKVRNVLFTVYGKLNIYI